MKPSIDPGLAIMITITSGVVASIISGVVLFLFRRMFTDLSEHIKELSLALKDISKEITKTKIDFAGVKEKVDGHNSWIKSIDDDLKDHIKNHDC